MGDAVGVKTQGGILDQVLREVEIECLPGDIPSHIDVDVTGMKMHDVVRVADLPHSGKLKFLTDEDATVAHVTVDQGRSAPAAGCGAALRRLPSPRSSRRASRRCGSGEAGRQGREEEEAVPAEAKERLARWSRRMECAA